MQDLMTIAAGVRLKQRRHLLVSHQPSGCSNEGNSSAQARSSHLFPLDAASALKSTVVVFFGEIW